MSDGTSESTATTVFLVEAAEPEGTCAPDSYTRCLRDSRYAVRMDWWTGDGEAGPVQVVHVGTNDSGLFRIFGAENWELLIKVLDGCALNGHVWVFAAATTNLGYRLEITDTVTGAIRTYRNEAGSPAAAITDSRAFPDGCRP